MKAFGWGIPAEIRRGDAFPVAVFLALCLALAGGDSPAREAVKAPLIQRVRFFSGPEHTRVVLDLTAPASFEIRKVHAPERLAINVPGFRLADPAPAMGAISVEDGLLRRIRRHQGTHRAQVVLDLEHQARYRSFTLPKTAGRPDRIVVDVLRPDSASQRNRDTLARERVSREEGKPFVVIVDAGHGGMDPGAIRDGLKEKDVVLDISREVVRLLNGIPGYRAYATRTGDYGLELWERVALARKKKGDLFLSVHCNTHPRQDVSGTEVYFLSLQGATDREARELADKENAAQLVGLDPAEGHDQWVMNILMDLRMGQVLHQSADLAVHLLDAARSSGLVRGRKVKQAGFTVLKSLAMPSALVEVAYLSNPADRKLLEQPVGRRRMAAVLVAGILAWRGEGEALARLQPEGTTRWTGRYRVRSGDSLWELAAKHGTTVAEISRRNHLGSRAIMIGQVLQLPEGMPQP